MRVAYQECGCIALPDEIVAALALAPGSVVEISHDPDSKTASIMAAIAPDDDAEPAAGASCRIRTDTK